ncbi:MAG: hypothetical protein KAG14_04695, partial [Mycoplasmataceae bacterium]|nr:hypothetical protein [Mycoplasmataceae bacterium]
FSNSEDYDFYIMGAAPKRTKDAPTKNNRGYYVKAKKVSKKKLIKTFKEMEWKGHSSANGGVAWFTKVDIIENYKRSKNENKR